MQTRGIETRRIVLDSALIRVEWLHVAGLTRERTPAVHSPDHQLLFPLAGAFNWHLGSSRTLLDANKLLFIAPGDVSRDSHPAAGDVGCLLITPSRQLVETTWQRPFSRSTETHAFARRVVPLHPQVQRMAAMLATAGMNGSAGINGMEEAAVGLLGRIAKTGPTQHGARNGNRKLVQAVKEMLATHDERLSLGDIAGRLGVSPAYLTDMFRRSEGMPIAKYHRRLRLARALIELPYATDITALALGFGFSSHAHFASAFKETYRETPSGFRQAALAQVRPPRRKNLKAREAPSGPASSPFISQERAAWLTE